MPTGHNSCCDSAFGTMIAAGDLPDSAFGVALRTAGVRRIRGHIDHAAPGCRRRTASGSADSKETLNKSAGLESCSCNQMN